MVFSKSTRAAATAAMTMTTADGGGENKQIAISPFFEASGNKKYWCYYPHRSRDFVSPMCGIFFYFFIKIHIYFQAMARAGGCLSDLFELYDVIWHIRTTCIHAVKIMEF